MPPPPGSTSRSQSPPSRSRSRHPSSNGNGNGHPSLSPSPIQQRGDSPYSLNGSPSASPSSPVPYRYPSPYPFPRNNPDVGANTSSNSNPNTANTTSSPISPNSNSANTTSAAGGASSSYNMYNPNPRRLSKDSEGYPSWLPRRPPPPAPASTLGQSSVIGGAGNYSLRTGTPGEYTATGTGTPSPVDPDEELIDVGPVNEFGELGYGSVDPFAAYGGVGVNPGGRKPTPRSVRIVTLQHEVVPGIVQPVEDTDFGFGNDDIGNEFGIATTSREPTDQTRVNFNDHNGNGELQGLGANAKGNASSSVPIPSHPGKARTKARTAVFSRSSLPPGAFLPAGYQQLQVQPPRFNAKNLQLQILRDPSVWMKLYWYVWPLLVLYHIPLQTYLDFGAVYVLIQ